jgi:hypothetical protein
MPKTPGRSENRRIDEVDLSRRRTRRSCLAAIAEEYTEEIYDPRAGRQLVDLEPVLRFAAITSPGPSDSEEAHRGNLIVADTAEALAELLRAECGEGWLAHGRAWDLDAPWHSWGNLSVAYSVSVSGQSDDDGGRSLAR